MHRKFSIIKVVRDKVHNYLAMALDYSYLAKFEGINDQSCIEYG